MNRETVDPMTTPRRFAHAVVDAFHAAGARTDADVARANGPSTSTMTKLRKTAEGQGTMPRPRRTTFEAIDRTARWPAGTAEAVWEGAEPPEPTELPEGARQIGDPEDDIVEFDVRGSFGVRAVVRGPIRDIDRMQEAVSRLIAQLPSDDTAEARPQP